MKMRNQDAGDIPYLFEKEKIDLIIEFLKEGGDRRKLRFTLALNREILKLSGNMFEGKPFPHSYSMRKERIFPVMHCAVGHGRNSESMATSGQPGIPSVYLGRWY